MHDSSDIDDDDDPHAPDYYPVSSSDSEPEFEDETSPHYREWVSNGSLPQDAYESVQMATSTSQQNPSHNHHSPTSYKIIGDNVDKNIVPRYIRSDNKVKSLHYYHSYAVKDRINTDSFGDVQPISNSQSHYTVVKSLLPSPSDDATLVQSKCENIVFTNTC